MSNNLEYQPSSQKRIEYIDALRGFTMFLVVLMHVGCICLNAPSESFHSFFQLVRMPMFFLISGFVFYKDSVVWNVAHIKKFFKKKIPVQLIGPFIFFVVYCHYKGYGIVHGILTAPKYGYWFTYVLFEYYVFYALIRFFLRKRWADIVLIVLGICFYPFSYPQIKDAIPIPNVILDFFSFPHWHFFIYFVLGTLLKKYFVFIQRCLDSKWLLASCILFFFLWNAFRDLLPLRDAVIDIPSELTGIVILFSFFRKNKAVFSKDNTVGRVFQYVGRRTLDIYLIHFFLLPLNLSFIKVFINHPMPVIELFVSSFIAVLIIAICLLIGNIIRLSPILGHWFFGVKREKSAS